MKEVYKLIKEYPGSSKVGYIINNDNGFVDAIRPQNYPEFWEKVVEKDYEILSFKPTDKHTGGVNQLITLQDFNYYRYQYNWASGGCTLDEMIVSVNKGYNSIHSVKRLSDGEIFTVGDVVDINNAIGSSNKNLTITGFNIGNVLSVLTNDKINNKYAGRKGFNISITEHSKRKPLFKTEDGVDIYEGDRYYYVYQWLINTKIATKGNYLGLMDYYYSTKELAEDYVLMNKPCLSIRDCMQVMSMFTMEDELKQIVKNKLK